MPLNSVIFVMKNEILDRMYEESQREKGGSLVILIIAHSIMSKMTL